MAQPTTIPLRRKTAFLVAGGALIVLLAAASLLVGAAELDPHVFMASRIPRTAALALAGAALAVVGLIMQLLLRNRFVEPSTTGSTDAASFALLLTLLFMPGLPLWARASMASAGALAAVLGFAAIAGRIPARSSVLVPVVGMLYGGIIGATATFIALRTETMQELRAWDVGDFSGVLRGRYELLYLAAAAAIVAWIAADRFTIAGLGRDVARGLGLHTRRTLLVGLTIIALVTGVVTVIAGVVPFLGLIVPNVVSRLIGDHMRAAVPLVAMLGASLLLLCDIVGRVVRFPAEIPVSVIMGVVGGVAFLAILLGNGRGRTTHA